MTAQLKASLAHWPEVSHAVFVPHSRREYDRLVRMLDDLIDEVGEQEDHPLASMMEVIGLLIEKYEDETVPQLS